VLKTQQQHKNSNAQSSSKVVVQQQRKTSAVKPTATGENKRKIKAEVTWTTRDILKSETDDAVECLTDDG